MPFCACVCPYAYPYALVKTRLYRLLYRLPFINFYCSPGPVSPKADPCKFCPHPCKQVLTVQKNCSRSASLILDSQIVHTHKFLDKLALSSAEKKITFSSSSLCKKELHLYNNLQKYLRHCNLFWLKWPGHDLVLVILPHPLSKSSVIQENA